MKEIIKNRIKVLALFTLFSSISVVKAQNTFNITVRNIVQTSLNKLEFDVYLLNTDSQPFELASCQLGFLFNSSILNSGTISSIAIDNSSSGLNASQLFTAAPSFLVAPTGYATQTLIRLAGKTPPGAGSGTIISSSGNGTLLTHFIITNSISFASNSTPNLVFCSSSVTTPLYATRVSQYVGTTNTPLVVDSGTNALVFGNPVLNPPIPDVPVASAGSGAACTQITANWSAAANADSYRLDVSTSNTFASYVSGYQDLNVGNVTTYNVILLTAGTTYYYRLRAVNTFGTSGNSNVITYATLAAAPGTPGSITGATTQCAGSSGQIYSISGVPNATTYTWTVPSGWNITAGNGTTSITVTAGSVGQNGNITVAAGNSCGTSGIRSLGVSVNPATPATPGTITGLSSQCAGITGQIYSIISVAGATTYTWTVPTGWSITAGAGTTSITVTAGSVGQNGNISVTAGNSCGTSSSSTLGVTVNPATPGTPGTISGNSAQCSGQTGQIYSISPVVNATNYTWSVPTGWSITAGTGTTSITVTTGSAGQNGNISVSAGNSCGTSSLSTLAVTVTSAPAIPGIITGTSAQCAALSGQIYSISSVAGATTYTWTVPAGWSITSGTGTTSIIVTTGSTGQNGDISVTAGNSCGTSSPRTLAVTVNPGAPVTPGAITGISTQCASLTGQIYSISTVPNASIYTWTVPLGWNITAGAGTTSITVTTGSAGQNGNISVTAGNGCGTSSASSIGVTVNPSTPAAPGAITGISVQCAGLTGQIYSIGLVANATTYTWTLPTGWSISAGAGTTSITITTGSSGQNGNISVTAGNSCGTSTASSMAVTVNPPAPSAPGAISGISAQCTSLVGQIYSISPVTNATTYTWTVPTGWNITSGAGTTSITVTTGSAGQNGNITVTAGNSCGTSLSSSLAVTVTTPPSVPTTVLTQPSCSVATGTITITAPTGVGMTYSIDGINYSNTTGIFSLVAPGPYTVTARNSTGCTSTGSVVTILAQPPSAIIPAQSTTISSGGTFIVNPTGGVIPPGTTYTWTAPTYTNGVTGGSAQIIPQANINGILTIPFGSGTAVYTVTPTSGPCIGATFLVTVTVNSTCVPVTIGTHPSSTSMCASAGNASFTVAANGSAPFVYQWQYSPDGITWTNVVNGTPSGAIYANATTAILSVTGITSSGSPQYRCFVTNCGGGNTASSNAATLTVNALPTPTLTSSDADNTFCLNTSVTFTAGGGTNYDFRVGGVTVQNGPSTTFTTSSLANGQIVTVVVTNANGCSATSAQIQNIVNPLPFIIISTSATCAPDFLTYFMGVTVAPGALVTSTSGIVTNTGGNVWTITSIPAGTNTTVRVTDAGGCINTIVVTAPNCLCPVVLPPVSGGDRSYCTGGVVPAITATVLTGETVDWYNSSSGGTPLRTGSLSYTPAGPGAYYAQARNTTSNCISSTRTPIIVTMNPLPIASLTSSDADNIFCAGTTVIFTAGGGTSYNFLVSGISAQNGVSPTFTTSSLTNGQVVSVIVTNANGCTSVSASITNTVNPLPTANAGSGGNACGLDFKFSAVPSIGTGTWTLTSGPGTALFSPNANTPTATVTVSEYGTYTFTWTEVNGTCSKSTTISVIFTMQPVASAGTGGNNCGLEFNMNATLNIGTGTWSKVSGPGNVSFSPDANSPTALVTVTAYGNYTFRWTVVNGTCSASATVSINFIQQTPANAGSDGSECDKDFVFNAVATTGTGTWTKVSGPGNAVFSPDNHQPNAKVTVDQFGAYKFAWTVVNISCTSSDIIDVVFHSLPTVNAGIDKVICKDNSVQLNAQGTGSFAWTPATLLNNPAIKDPVATPLTSTTFTVVLTDQFGCKNSDAVLVEVREKPVANAGPDQVLEYILVTSMNAVLAQSYETGTWSVISGTGNFTDINYTKTTVENLSIGLNKFLWTVSNGVCPSSSDSVNIEVHDFIIPTLITPNMDGINDYFVLQGLSTLGKTELIVFDRRGVQVYKNSDYDNLWNGVDYNENPLASDTYYYVLKSENGQSRSGYIVIRY